jgi:hypothetical protein
MKLFGTVLRNRDMALGAHSRSAGAAETSARERLEADAAALP